MAKNNKKKQRNRGRVSRTNNENEKEEQEKKKDRFVIFKHAAKFVLGVKNISVNLTKNQGTFIPGFLPEANFFGQHWGKLAPGIPFVLGSQKELISIAGDRGWLTQNENINTLYKRNSSTNLVLRSTVEPFNKTVSLFCTTIKPSDIVDEFEECLICKSNLCSAVISLVLLWL